MKNEYNEYISRKDLSELTGRNPKTIYKASNRGKLKVVKVGKINRIPKGSAWKWWVEHYADKEDAEKNMKIRRALQIDGADMTKELSSGELSTDERVDAITEDGRLSGDVIESTKHDSGQEEDTNSMVCKHEDIDPFKDHIATLDWYTDSKGVYFISDDRRIYIANFSTLKFLYNMKSEKGRVRVVLIDNIKFELTPRELLNSNNFNLLTLANSKFRLVMNREMFQCFQDIILDLDNGKELETLPGIGWVHPDIINLGNKLYVLGEHKDTQEVVWIGTKGYLLQFKDKIKLAEDGFSFDEIWDKFYKLYGMNAILIVGFATATAFFSQLLEEKGSFPILYINGGSGRGKSCLAELILKLFGMDTSFGSVNISANATKVGIETKSMLLKNLPLAIHEHNKDHLDLIKYRFDGQGSVKYDQNSSDNLSQRHVEGSTIITSVERPMDKQITSRCVFIDLDHITMKKELFDKVRREASRLSGFITTVLDVCDKDSIMLEADKVAFEVQYNGYMPRICDNYCLIAGAFLSLINKLDDTSIYPARDMIISFIQSEISKAEELLNPLIYFVREVERIRELPQSNKFITEDNEHLYFNFNYVWDTIHDSYKVKYFPYLKASNIRKYIKESDYIEIYGDKFLPGDASETNKPITSFPKKIDGKTRRCCVLKKDKLPGYFS